MWKRSLNRMLCKNEGIWETAHTEVFKLRIISPFVWNSFHAHEREFGEDTLPALHWKLYTRSFFYGARPVGQVLYSWKLRIEYIRNLRLLIDNATEKILLLTKRQNVLLWWKKKEVFCWLHNGWSYSAPIHVLRGLFPIKHSVLLIGLLVDHCLRERAIAVEKDDLVVAAIAAHMDDLHDLLVTFTTNIDTLCAYASEASTRTCVARAVAVCLSSTLHVLCSTHCSRSCESNTSGDHLRLATCNVPLLLGKIVCRLLNDESEAVRTEISASVSNFVTNDSVSNFDTKGNANPLAADFCLAKFLHVFPSSFADPVSQCQSIAYLVDAVLDLGGHGERLTADIETDSLDSLFAVEQPNGYVEPLHIALQVQPSTPLVQHRFSTSWHVPPACSSDGAVVYIPSRT